MQGKFALNEDQAHIAKFSEYMCDLLIAACNQVYEICIWRHEGMERNMECQNTRRAMTYEKEFDSS